MFLILNMSGFWVYYGSKYAKVTHGFEYDLFLQVVWVLYGVNKDQGNEALPFLVFQRDIVNAIFLKYSKEDTLSSSHVGILNIPSDIYYGYTKHYQLQSEHRCTQNPYQASKIECFCVNSQCLKVVNWIHKTLQLRCFQGFWICLW